MISVCRIGCLIAAVAGCLGSSLVVADDACRAQIPESLSIAVAEKFPAFDLPLVADNLPEDIEYSKKNGASGCLGVAAGDFEGTGAQGYALALKRRGREDSITVVAVLRPKGWSFRTISTGDLRIRLYVGVVPAGRYDASGVSEDPKARGELDVLVCPHAGIVTGETEATGMVYCLAAGKWKHVVVSD